MPKQVLTQKQIKDKFEELERKTRGLTCEVEDLNFECFCLYEGLDEWRKRALKAEEELKKLKEESAGPCSC